MFMVGGDLGKTQDYTAISIIEQQTVEVATPKPHTERHYHLRYLDRGVPLVVDMFTAAGVRPHAVTITGGDVANKENLYDLRVPKRELASVLVALYQGHRLKTAKELALAPTLLKELVNFKVKIHLSTGQDSYEARRESIHDDLVLSVALACWYEESAPQFPFAWIRNDPAFQAQFAAQAKATAPVESDQERITRRMAAAGMVPDEAGGHRYGAPLPNRWAPERHG